MGNIPSTVTYQIINSLYVRNNEQLIDVPDEYGETMSISIAELMVGTNRLSPYNYNGAADPHLEPYTYYSVACNNAYTYYVYDHLSNTRITYTPTVTNNAMSYHLNGVFDYYPYAKILREYIDGQQEKYLSTHHERDVETGLDYRGARFYDCDIARFLSLDPLAEKYPMLSPYMFVGGNPLLYIDPDGRKIEFAKDATPEFKKQFAEAVKYLNKHGCGEMLKKLQDLKDKTIIIKETKECKGIFTPENNTIEWNPTIGLFTTNNKTLSPSSVLNHEIDHALEFNTHPEDYLNNIDAEDPSYKNKEEKRVITGSEQVTAKKTKEINSNLYLGNAKNTTRDDHEGTFFKAESVTRNKLGPTASCNNN